MVTFAIFDFGIDLAHWFILGKRIPHFPDPRFPTCFQSPGSNMDSEFLSTTNSCADLIQDQSVHFFLYLERGNGYQ